MNHTKGRGASSLFYLIFFFLSYCMQTALASTQHPAGQKPVNPQPAVQVPNAEPLKPQSTAQAPKVEPLKPLDQQATRPAPTSTQQENQPVKPQQGVTQGRPGPQSVGDGAKKPSFATPLSMRAHIPVWKELAFLKRQKDRLTQAEKDRNTQGILEAKGYAEQLFNGFVNHLDLTRLERAPIIAVLNEIKLQPFRGDIHIPYINLLLDLLIVLAQEDDSYAQGDQHHNLLRVVSLFEGRMRFIQSQPKFQEDVNVAFVYGSMQRELFKFIEELREVVIPRATESLLQKGLRKGWHKKAMGLVLAAVLVSGGYKATKLYQTGGLNSLPGWDNVKKVSDAIQGVASKLERTNPQDVVATSVSQLLESLTPQKLDGFVRHLGRHTTEDDVKLREVGNKIIDLEQSLKRLGNSEKGSTKEQQLQQELQAAKMRFRNYTHSLYERVTDTAVSAVLESEQFGELHNIAKKKLEEVKMSTIISNAVKAAFAATGLENAPELEFEAIMLGEGLANQSLVQLKVWDAKLKRQLAVLSGITPQESLSVHKKIGAPRKIQIEQHQKLIQEELRAIAEELQKKEAAQSNVSSP